MVQNPMLLSFPSTPALSYGMMLESEAALERQSGPYRLPAFVSGAAKGLLWCCV